MTRLSTTVSLLAAALLATLCASAQPTVVNDVTQLNPIVVDEVVEPTSVDEVVAAVRSHAGPISVGGGRFSMGGQTADDHATQLDMRKLNRVVTFDADRKLITVQAGITWRAIQQFIDPYNLSVRIMQTYASFTVGGSVSVNAHGRYVGEGPLVRSIESLRIVLADGRVVTASPAERPEVFYGAVGGYGALGVIVEVTLRLADNVRMERSSSVMPLKSYRAYFDQHVRGRSTVVFHNADIYPPKFDTVRATSYAVTTKPLTIADRLMPADQSHSLEHSMIPVVADWTGGKWFREHVLEPVYFGRPCVEWRNYEASQDVSALEPRSRVRSTYVLQEYFVPVDKLEPFVHRLADVLSRHEVNAINLSIRHALPDPGTDLAWARSEVFALVLYYKQGTADSDRAHVGRWTRELIDEALKVGGTYYLPYQIWATQEQFHAAYPDAEKLFALKRQLDPTNKFRNRLLDTYYSPVGAAP